MLQGCDLSSRHTRDMKNNMEARTYAHTHIVLAREIDQPTVLHSRRKQLNVRRMQGISPWVATYATKLM